MPLTATEWLEIDQVHCGDAPTLLDRIAPESIALSVWSPPYHVGKKYEQNATFETWKTLLQETIQRHHRVLSKGGFLVVNIADIQCFKDSSMPRIQAPNLTMLKSPVTREDVLKAQQEHPEFNRYQLAALLGCSEQTVDRRLKGNNIRGGKYTTQTRVQLVGHLLDQFAYDAGLYLYDRRIWVKDPTWANSQWHSNSYRSVSEFEDLYIFWKPGETPVDRNRLEEHEWSQWGSRQVWQFPSVRANDDHEAKFPVELPRRFIRMLTAEGDTVLDCFMGSGTTAVAALREGRHFIGIDITPEYVKLAEKTIKKEVASLKSRLF
ncbi:MAG: site-specific DNA-methyltransferase [Planctomycetia bacterium]|nr:site-specific DNA-methyltransferase [Planctomycetia bacterium]